MPVQPTSPLQGAGLPPPGGPGATPPPADATDAQYVVDQAVEVARKRLQGLPPEALAEALKTIAAGALQAYRDAIAAGKPVGIAVQMALGDADNQALLAAEKNGLPPPTATGEPDPSIVSREDVAAAWAKYKDGIARGDEIYADATKGPVTPGARESITKVAIDPVEAAKMSPAERLKAALQGTTTVEGTDTRDLEATARGEGAGGALAAARLKRAQQQSGQTTNAAIQAARGGERKGLRRANTLAQGERDLATSTQIEELNQADRQAAQAKIAELDTQRKQLQAQLDSARAANDQTAINTITQKMADLDQETAKANQAAENAARDANANRSVTTQTTNNTQALQAQDQDEKQRVEATKLRIEAQKALEASAQGLLNESDRQAKLAQFQQQMDIAERELEEAIRSNRRQEEIAEKQANRQFWGQMISSLIGGAAAAGTAAITKSDKRAKEDIEPAAASDLEALANAVAKSVATFKYKRGEGPPGERAGVMAQDLERTRLGDAVVSETDDGDKAVDYGALSVLLAAAVIKARKGRGG